MTHRPPPRALAAEAECDEYRVRDLQWVEKWKAALDLLDKPLEENQKLRALLAEVLASREWIPDEMEDTLDRIDAALSLSLPPVPWAADEADLPDDGDVVTHRPITLPGHYPDWRRAAEPLALWLALAVGWLVVWGAK